MKNRNIILTLLAATFLSSPLLHADTADLSAQLETIRTLLKPDKADTSAAKAAKTRLHGLPDTWQHLLDSNQTARFSDYGMSGMETEFSSVPGLTQKADAFLKSVKQEADRRDAAKITEAEALLAETGEQLKNAKKPEDLDALFLKLNKNKIPDYGNNAKLSAISRDLQNALQITTCWQNYLIAKEAGKDMESRQNLQQISSSLSSTPIIPRSYVLRLINSIAPESGESRADDTAATRNTTDEISTRLAETGDTAAALAEFKTLPKPKYNGSDESVLLHAIQTADDLRKLEPTMSEPEVLANIRNINSNGTSQRRFSLNRAYDQIALNAIARSYGIETPSTKTTSARKVLESIFTSALAKQDWQKLRQVLTSLENLNTPNYGQDSMRRMSDQKIVSLLEVGKQSEQRGDIEAAATAYLEASSLDGLYMQRDFGFARLAELKQKNPEKVGPIIAKAEENRQRTETARIAAEVEMRQRAVMPMNRSQDLASLRPLVQEVVADFLKKQREETAKPAAPETTPKDAPDKK